MALGDTIQLFSRAIMASKTHSPLFAVLQVQVEPLGIV